MWMCSNFLPNKLHPFPLLTLFFAAKQKSKANVLHIHWIHCWFVLKWLQCVWFFVFYPIFTHTHTHIHIYWRVMRSRWMSDGESSYKWVNRCILYNAFGAVVIVHQPGNSMKQTDFLYHCHFTAFSVYIYRCVVATLLSDVFEFYFDAHGAYFPCGN